MIVYKLAGAALMIVCGGLAGRAICQRSEASLSQTEAFITLIKYIRNQIDCYLMPVDKILAGCPPGMLDACGAGAGGVPAVLASAGAAVTSPFADLLGRCALNTPPEVSGLLFKFAGELGAGYRDTQLKLCDYYVGKLSAERDRMRADQPARRKMIMTLCLCACAGAAVIMF